jgi:membrane-bound serine protease (ClpP class)
MIVKATGVDHLLASLSPEVVYLLLLGALWFAATAIYVPGTGIIEAAALGVLAAGLFVLTRQPTNWVAVILIVVGTLTFLLFPFFSQKYGRLAIGGLGLQVMGSLFLFDGKSVNPLMIVFSVAASLAYYQFVLTPVMKWVREQKPVEDEKLVDSEGVVVTPLNPTGTVKMRGETWTAYSDTPIASGERIFVIKRDGLQLYVEHIKNKHVPQVEDEDNSGASQLS